MQPDGQEILIEFSFLSKKNKRQLFYLYSKQLIYSLYSSLFGKQPPRPYLILNHLPFSSLVDIHQGKVLWQEKDLVGLDINRVGR